MVHIINPANEICWFLFPFAMMQIPDS